MSARRREFSGGGLLRVSAGAADGAAVTCQRSGYAEGDGLIVPDRYG